MSVTSLFSDDEPVFILLHVSLTCKEQDNWEHIASMMFLNYMFVNKGIYYKNTLYNVMSKLVYIYCTCHVKFCFHVIVSQI